MTRHLLRLVCAVAVAGILAGCSSSHKDDTLAILKTVPADAQMVAVVNAEQVIDKGALPESLDKLPTAGVALNSLVMFVNSQERTIISGLLDDRNAFMQAVEKSGGEKFEQQGNLWLTSKCAVSSEGFWYAADRRIDPEKVKEYAALDEKNSFAANKYSSELASSSSDGVYLVNLNAILDAASGSLPQAKLGVSMLFVDPAWIAGTVDGEKGKATFSASVLNSDFKPSQFQFETSDIDTKAIGYLRSGSVVAALGLSDAMKSQIATLASGFGGAQAKQFLDLIGGTLAVSVDPASGKGSFAIQAAKGKESQLQALLAPLASGYAKMSVALQGDYIVGSEGSLQGSVPSEVSGKFKDAVLALWMSGAALEKKSSLEGVSDMYILLKPESKSLRLDAEILLKDKNASFWAFAASQAKK